MKKDLFRTFFVTKKRQKINLLYRSSRQRSSLKKVFLKNFTKFTGKYLYWSLFFKKENPPKVFSCEFCEIFKNTFLTEHLLASASFCNSSHSFILQRSFICLFKPSFVTKINKNSQFYHIFILQIHVILYIMNVFYRGL